MFDPKWLTCGMVYKQFCKSTFQKYTSQVSQGMGLQGPLREYKEPAVS